MVATINRPFDVAESVTHALRADFHRLAQEVADERKLGQTAAYKTAAKILNATCAGIIADELESVIKPQPPRLPGM